MTRDERLDRIDELKASNDQLHAERDGRARARELDPFAYDDYLRAERSAEPERGAYVQRESSQAGLVFKTNSNALVPVSTADDDTQNEHAWNLWIRRHLDVERRGLLDALERDMGDTVATLRAERTADTAALRRELTELRRALQERDERSRALGELKHELAGERVEREALQLSAALAVRDAKIEKLEMQVRMLCQFLSVGGLDLPKGL
jgi:hypothetical protein